MIAFSIDNLLFILLLAAAGLFQLLSKAVTKTKKNEPDEKDTPPNPLTTPPIRRAPAEPDEERIRKFLEALGQPPTSAPPRPVAPRTDIPPRRLAPVQPPSVMPQVRRVTREQEQKRDVPRKETPPPLPPAYIEHAQMGAPAQLAFDVHKGGLAAELEQPSSRAPIEIGATTTPQLIKADGPNAEIAALLRSNSGLREAIILREIFGPPRGLEMFDFV